MDPDNEDAYVPHVYVCFACAAKERKAAAMTEESMVGAYITVDLEVGDDDDED